MTYATISSKGQITLPVRYLRELGLKANDRIKIEEVTGGLQLSKAPDFLAMKGIFKGRKRVDERLAAMTAAAERSIGRRP